MNIKILLLLLLLLSGISSPQTQQWVEVEGKWKIANITPEIALERAKDLARREAIRRVLGEHIRSEILVHNYRLGGEFIHAFSYGHILKEIIKEVNVRVQTVDKTSLPDLYCTVRMACLVKEEKQKADPSFQVDITLNKDIYFDNEPIFFKVRATRDCYIYVFNITSDEKAIILFPNLREQNNFIPANKDIQIPNKNQTHLFNFTVHCPPNKTEVNEFVQIIATKRPVPFWETLQSKQIYKIMLNKPRSLMELAEWLGYIPPSEKAEAITSYIVKNR